MRVGSPTERLRALVVEDCDELRYILVKLLGRHGFNVSAFSNAPDALEAWADGGANLLVTDITLPRMSGVQFLKELDRTQLLGSAGVVIVTATARLDPPLPRAVVVQKPFAVASFDAAVERALSLPRELH